MGSSKRQVPAVNVNSGPCAKREDSPPTLDSRIFMRFRVVETSLDVTSWGLGRSKREGYLGTVS